MAKTNGAQAFPFGDFDVTKMMGEFKFPFVDVDAFVETQRKNFEAVTAANQKAVEGYQALAQRQFELMQSAFDSATKSATEVMEAASPEDKAAKQADATKAAYETAVGNFKELYELAAKSNLEAADLINTRITASIDELKTTVAKAGK